VLEVQEYTAVPRALAYGVVEAQRNWQGIAEVGGRVIEKNERLEVGRRIRQGTVLFRIDPGSYAVEKDRTEATVKATKAQISELRAREASARANLKVEEKVLVLARKDLARLEKLLRQDAVSQLDVDAAERDVLSAERSVQSFKNTLSELPASRRVLQANLEQVQAGVAGANLDLARTEIVAPFTMRIREVHAIDGQAISSGQVLVVGDAVDIMEVPAQLPLASVTPLMPPRGQRRGRRQDGSATPRDPAPEAADAKQPGPTTAPPRRGRLARAIQATVHLKGQGMLASWPAEFRRFEGIDSATQTMGLVVQVTTPQRGRGNAAGESANGRQPDAEQPGGPTPSRPEQPNDSQPQGSGAPGQPEQPSDGQPPGNAVQSPQTPDRANQPRLLPGMHVEVELTGEPRSGCLAVPRTALHEQVVWVVGPKNRLELREVDIAFVQDDFVCITTGIAVGEQVVLTDLAPAVAGMVLDPRVDDLAQQRLAQATQGQDS